MALGVAVAVCERAAMSSQAYSHLCNSEQFLLPAAGSQPPLQSFVVKH